ncbi:MAG: DUF2029 domain-containing protein [Candidatus Dormibacteraeota bacterium]|nr:DUF2029 domain-containing protein [Candidatus Dormibacteraeota bacterium]
MLQSRESLLLLALTALTAGTMLHFGDYDAVSFVLLVTGCGVMAFALRAEELTDAGTGTWVLVLLGIGALGLCYARFVGLPLLVPLSLLLAATGAAAIAVKQRRTRLLLLTLSGVALAAMIAMFWTWGAPLDVFSSVQSASSALLAGHNPYSTTFAATVMYGPGIIGTQIIHFQYLPGVAILAAPARLLGDSRISGAVAAAVLFVFTVGLARQGEATQSGRTLRVTALALVLPVTATMTHYGWVDVYAMAGFAGWLALRRDHRHWAVVALATALTIKPTILIALVPMFLWSSRARREMVASGVIAGAVMLPFILATGFGSFYQDVIGIQSQLGVRYDSLTANVAWFNLTGSLLPAWFGPALGAAIAIAVLRRRPSDLSDVLAAAALLATAAFLLSKWAFFNYYYVPIWLLILAAAGRGLPFEVRAADVVLPWFGLQRSRFALRRSRSAPAV